MYNFSINTKNSAAACTDFNHSVYQSKVKPMCVAMNIQSKSCFVFNYLGNTFMLATHS